MKDKILNYDGRVPRYTSYPTAPHFNKNIDENVFIKWLGDISEKETLSLYFHIPFCQKMCSFCGCFTKVTRKYDPVETYLEPLLKEIEMVAGKMPVVKKNIVKHIHFGGGTPTILKAEHFDKIFEQIRKYFTISKNAEIAIEIDPREISDEKIAAMKKNGVNRASIGVQDFEPKTQEIINRVQPYELTKQVIDDLRKNGVNNISLDLMYGLPYQTRDSIIKNVKTALTLKPNRISLFGYAHVPWMKKHQRLLPEEILPNAEQRLDMYFVASEELEKNGFTKIGIDHFALEDDEMAISLKKKKLTRNFQGYTTDAANHLIGFGVSSISSMGQGYKQNILDRGEYEKLIMEGKFPVSRGVELSKDDKIRREIIMKLMCDLEAEIDVSYFASELGKLKIIADDGFIYILDNKIIIKEEGRIISRNIAGVFDKYLEPKENQHSKAI